MRAGEERRGGEEKREEGRGSCMQAARDEGRRRGGVGSGAHRRGARSRLGVGDGARAAGGVGGGSGGDGHTVQGGIASPRHAPEAASHTAQIPRRAQHRPDSASFTVFFLEIIKIIYSCLWASIHAQSQSESHCLSLQYSTGSLKTGVTCDSCVLKWKKIREWCWRILLQSKACREGSLV